jgi:hypothetical protein
MKICTSFLLIASAVAFAPSTKLSNSKSIKYPYPTHIPSIFDDDDAPKSENEFEGFNPFDRKKPKSRQRAPQIFESTTISVRKMRMRDLINELLNADETKFQSLLLENEELLMDPLLNDDAVLEKDTIYEKGMTVEERFEKYETVMLAREEKAVNKKAARILAGMREFVMSRRESA